MSEPDTIEHALVASLLWVLVVAAPLGVIVPFNAYKAILGRGAEPLADNVLMYVVLLVVFTAAALGILALFRQTIWLTRWPRPAANIVAGAAGAGALMTLLDAMADYFTPGGVGWLWPTTGLVLGALFGAAFAGLHAIRND